jgi:cellulose synthase/poly-beta-1,6-N-acetylglucosamine synthase-like glycosyltransferase
LLPALNYSGKDDIIVTADDDILYDRNWLKTIVDASYLEPDSIVCCRARFIKKNIFNRWQNLYERTLKGFNSKVL